MVLLSLLSGARREADAPPMNPPWNVVP